MRNLIYSINMSLDGCVDHTKMTGGEEILDYFAEFLRSCDTLLYGRITYELMVPYWPDIAKNRNGNTKEIEFAEAFDAVGKIVVVSRSLDKVKSKNTEIVRTNLREEIGKLKQQPGKDIATGGSALASQLIALGLVDEYNIVVQPVIAGEGRRLMEGIPLQERLQLKLVGTTTLKSGYVALRYLKQ